MLTLNGLRDVVDGVRGAVGSLVEDAVAYVDNEHDELTLLQRA